MDREMSMTAEHGDGSDAHPGCGFGPFTLDVEGACLRLRGAPLPLRPKEFDLLAYLVAHAGRVVTKDELHRQLWPDVIVSDDSLTRTVSDLRAALGEDGRDAIRTVHKRGYALDWPVWTHPVPTSGVASGPAATLPRDDAQLSVPAPIGRSRVVAELSALLDRERIVTIIGPAGVGKTHLAKWLARSQAHAKVHGVALLDLSAIADAALVVDRAFAAVGLGATSGQGLEALVSHLRPLQALLVVDNAEHLVEAAARLVAAIAAGTPGVQVLVSSQRPLRIAGEALYRLAPLELPRSGDVGDEATASEEPGGGALAMLTWRLRELGSKVEPTDDTHLRRICVWTDGLPLAIELAASRIPQFGARGVLELLDVGPALLDQGRRDAAARHGSVDAAIDWSMGLLTSSHRTVLVRLGVFVGGFTLDAARQTLPDAELGDALVVEAIGALAESSLLQFDPSSARYRLLEPVRQCVCEQLQHDAAAPLLRARHARYFRAHFHRALGMRHQLDEPFDGWRARLLADADNARSACHWALSAGDAESALVLAAALADMLGSEWPTDRRQLLALTEASVTEASPPEVIAPWLLAAAHDQAAARPAQAHAHAVRAARLFEAAGDRVGRYRALSIQLYCASMTASASASTSASAHLTGDLEPLKATFDPNWSDALAAEGANAIACWWSAQGDFPRSLAWRRRTLALYRRAGWRWRECTAQANVCDTLLASGDTAGAIETGEQLLASLGATRWLSVLPAVRLNLAAAYLQQGDAAGARSLAEAGWRQAMDLGWTPYWSDHLALMAALTGHFEATAQLLGFSAFHHRRIGAEREVNEAQSAQRAEGIARARMTPEQYERWFRVGEGLQERDVATLLSMI